MRRWQLRKIREAGLDPYMRGTWTEAQSAIAAARARAQELSAAIDAQPAADVIRHVHTNINDPGAPKPRGGKPLRACPYCGVEFKALHWHVPKCKMRPAA